MLLSFLQVLEDNLDLLSRNLEPRRHYAFLRSAAVLDSEDQETIDCQTTRKQRAITFVDIVRRKGPRAYDALCASLEQEKTQLFLLTQLNKSLEHEIGKSCLFSRDAQPRVQNWGVQLGLGGLV